MPYTKKQLGDYSEIEYKFCTLFPEMPVRTVLDKLHRYETTLSRINENDCNGHPRMQTEYRDGKTYQFAVEDQKWKELDEKKEKSIHGKVIELLKPYNIAVQFNGDPRGGAIRMKLPDNTSNNWDGETWGIYW